MRRSGRSWPRQNRGYVLLKVDTAEDDAWMSQREAARHLGVTLIRVGMLIANRRLIPTESLAGQAGVTTASVQAEETWRATATKRAKLARLLKDTINWV
ncbi:DNA-binding protein [Streptomyces sp. NPDC005476]|uniref:DNA-binding protein n=1 Tax=Streptomyces sp. NPDC005476 TaxID=3156882 RepID=UPI0034557911